jgi:hypothetical protein
MAEIGAVGSATDASGNRKKGGLKNTQKRLQLKIARKMKREKITKHRSKLFPARSARVIGLEFDQIEHVSVN